MTWFEAFGAGSVVHNYENVDFFKNVPTCTHGGKCSCFGERLNTVWIDVVQGGTWVSKL